MTIKGIDVDLEKIAATSGHSVEDIKKLVEQVQKGLQTKSRGISALEDGRRSLYTVERKGIGKLLTGFGAFWQYDFLIDDRWGKYSVVARCDEIDHETLLPKFHNNERLLIRIDSGCETGQVFGDFTCDCLQQLHIAMKGLAERGQGLIIHVPRQDGRGMGLPFKLATLWLQDVLSINTVESASLISPDGDIDSRTYSGITCILKFLEVPESCKIDLMTNNPLKAVTLEENGFTVENLIQVRVAPTIHTRAHFDAKKEHLGHKLNDDD